MSKENLIKLFEAAVTDESLGEQLQKVQNYDEFKSVAAKHGCNLDELTESDAVKIVGELAAAAEQEEKSGEELSDQELEAVAGGASRSPSKATLFQMSFLGLKIPEIENPGRKMPGLAVPPPESR